jgi:hypothetical protein
MESAQLIQLLLGAIASLASALAFMYRAESKRKDALIERLLNAALKQTDVTDRTVSLAETREKRMQR